MCLNFQEWLTTADANLRTAATKMRRIRLDQKMFMVSKLKRIKAGGCSKCGRVVVGWLWGGCFEISEWKKEGEKKGW
jgi:hypothetical protein